ncbi:hypothetical protein CCR95_08175 [Thiocystis minor]|nr:hypothetical protein [Thiocystis minor]
MAVLPILPRGSDEGVRGGFADAEVATGAGVAWTTATVDGGVDGEAVGRKARRSCRIRESVLAKVRGAIGIPAAASSARMSAEDAPACLAASMSGKRVRSDMAAERRGGCWASACKRVLAWVSGSLSWGIGRDSVSIDRNDLGIDGLGTGLITRFSRHRMPRITIIRVISMVDAVDQPEQTLIIIPVSRVFMVSCLFIYRFMEQSRKSNLSFCEGMLIKNCRIRLKTINRLCRQRFDHNSKY